MNTSIDLTNTNNYARALLTRLLTHRSLFLILLLFACVGLAPNGLALTPAPDGGYPNGNTAEGTDPLRNLTSGANNTALGFQALYHNTTGNANAATGFRALFSNTTGRVNTANGPLALYQNTEGTNNTATGVYALRLNTVGGFNTAEGSNALESNTGGFSNTATGFRALHGNTTGNNNTAIGWEAGVDLASGDNNIYVANTGLSVESNTIRIGTQLIPDSIIDHPPHTAAFIAGISGTAVTGPAVVVNANGQLGVAPSSQRFKTEIKPMEMASQAILALKPVSFRYKPEVDPKRTVQFGLVAEDVAKVNPDLVTRDAKGEIYTVRYEAVNAMLLNEFLKEHRKVEKQDRKIQEQETTIAQLKKGMEVLTASLKEQGAQIQKVSDQLELNKPAPQIVENQ